MDNYIKTVSLTYNSTNVKPSTILSYFFRMIGTYIQENVIDVSQNTHFPESSCLNIFLISKPKDLEFINQNCQNVKNKVLVTDNKDLEANDILYYSLETKENKIKFLKDIVSFALESIKNEDNRKEIKASLEEIIENYIENRIVEKMLIRKFQFDDSPLYEDFIDSTEKAIKTINYNFDNKNLLHANYILIRLAYESSAVSCRNNKSMNWSSSEMLSLNDKLLKQFPFLDNLYLLKANILTDLKRLPDVGFEEYKKTKKINSNHPEALLKKGDYIVKHMKNSIEEGLQYYTKAIEVYSPFYKALYFYAYYFEEYSSINNKVINIEEYLSIYNKIPEILDNKLRNTENNPNFQILLRPREIQFLYFAYLKMGLYVYNNRRDYQDYLTSFYCLQNADNLYNYYIDQNKFIQTVFDEDCSSEINKLIKKQLQSKANDEQQKALLSEMHHDFDGKKVAAPSQKIVKIKTNY